MKKHSFLTGAILLTAGGFFAKIIGAFYKIPLTNILGANGMGIYHLIFPFYSLMLVVSSSGISVAVSKLIAEARAQCNKQNEQKILKLSIIFVLLLSLLLTLITMAVSVPLAAFQGNINASLGYVVIAPSIIFASVIAVLRGYFQGAQNMIPTSASNIFEQIIKLVTGLWLSNVFISRGVEYAVLGAVLGVSISEAVTLLLLIINYMFHKKKHDYENLVSVTIKSTKLTNSQIFKQIAMQSVPATLSSLILPLTAFLDSFMVINILINTGFSSTVATSLYGINNGIVSTVISLPVLVTASVSVAMVPNLSGLYAQNKKEEVEFKTSFFIKITWLLALPCFVLFLMYSPDIIDVLYKNGLSDRVLDEFSFAYKLLMVSSVSIIYYAFLYTFTSVLQSINKPALPFYSLLTALFVRVALIYVLLPIPQLNIFGVVVANIVFLSLATVINLYHLRKYLQLNFSFVRTFLMPIFAAGIMGVIVYLIRLGLSEMVNPFIYGIIGGAGGLLLYVAMIIAFRCFTEKEKEMLPKINLVRKKKHKV